MRSLLFNKSVSPQHLAGNVTGFFGWYEQSMADTIIPVKLERNCFPFNTYP